jgi:hypothetical protein
MASSRHHPQALILLAVLAAPGLGTPARALDFAGGTGTPEDPYQIAMAEQLVSLGGNQSLWDKHFALVADIVLDPNLPGPDAFPFRGHPSLYLSTGSLDGCGHEIRNLTSRGGGALFAYIGRDAIVRGLVLKDAVVESGMAVLAEENQGLIVSCSVEGTLSGWGSPKTAALVASNSGVIMHCRTAVRVTGAAGFVGVNYGTIVACYATGPVSKGYNYDSYCLAGLVGENFGTISRCYASGAVSAPSEDANYTAAGLVGRNSSYGTIERCYASGDVSGSGTTAGLVVGNSGTIKQCYASGKAQWPLVGEGEAKGVLNCYFLARPGDPGENQCGVPMSDTQMRRRESFIGWDFWGDRYDGAEDTWMMPADGGYPVLALVERPTSGGGGTAEDPYILESPDQLLGICRDQRAHYRLGADIDMQGRSFSSAPIRSFQGYLDGDGHSVGNFTLAGPRDLAFLGILYPQATIVNLHLQPVRITVEDDLSPVGALAVINRGKIMNCTASVEIQINSAPEIEFLGGLVGSNEGGELRQCSACCYCYGVGGYRDTLRRSGGLIGNNAGVVAECHALCFANGQLFDFGALVGQNSGTITDCYGEGYLSSYLNPRYAMASPYMGGLVGWNVGTIANCYATTAVAAHPINGGLIGHTSANTIMSSFFLSEADGGGPDNGLGTPLSAEEMSRQASFVGWDFMGVWMICEGRDYPRLRWEGVECE